MNAPAARPAVDAASAPAPQPAPPPEPPPPVKGSAVACSACCRAFLAPTDEPSAVIECPCCGAHLRRGALLGPPADGRSPRRAARWVGVAVLAVGSALSLLGALALAFRRFQPAPGSLKPAAAAPAPDPAQDAALREARAAAEAALASPDWRAAQAHVLDADRLGPLMERYHTQHAWVPMRLVGPHSGSLTSTRGTRTARLIVPSDRGVSLTLHLQETPEGWKLDWERLVNARQFEWQRFHDNPPDTAGTPTVLEVLAVRGSADDTHYASAGLTRETGLAVRLDGPRPGLPVLAIVPKASDLGRLFQRELTWEQARPYRCRLRMADTSLVPPRVEITEFAGEGWSGE